MNDPLLVRGLERVGDLFRDRERLGERQGQGDRFRQAVGPETCPPNAFRKRRAFDQLHHESSHVASGFSRTFFETVDRGDVRMVQRGEDLRFADEPCEAIGIVGDGGQQHFDRDVAIQLRVARAIHLAHAADANRIEDFKNAEACAGG